MLGQGHIGVNIGLEYCDSVNGYGSMEAPASLVGDDAKEWMVQGCDGTNPLKKKIAAKKEQKVARDVTPRKKKPVTPVWTKSIKKKVIPGSAGVKQNKPKCFVKAIQDEVVQLTKDRVYVPVKETHSWCSGYPLGPLGHGRWFDSGMCHLQCLCTVSQTPSRRACYWDMHTKSTSDL